VLAQDVGGGQRLERRHVAGAGDHHVRVAAAGGGPLPDAEPPGAVQVRGLGVQPVELRLLAGHDDVDVVRALQAVPHRREQRVGVRRQVDPDHLGLLVDHVVDEPRVLVGEAVVVLAPHVRGEQVVERGDRRPPLQRPGGLEPLGVLVDHRVDDVDERLVAAEQPVPPGEQVALQPALAGVLGQHLDHPALGREVLVDLLDPTREDLVGDLVDRVQPVGRGLVGPEDAEVVGVVAHHVDEVVPQHPRGLVDRAARRRYVDRVVPEVAEHERPAQQSAVGVRVRAHPPMTRRRQRAQPLDQPPLLVEELLGPVGPHPRLELPAMPVVVPGGGQRDLMGAPGALDLHPVDAVRAGPPLRRHQQDHRPRPPLEVAVLAGRALDLQDQVVGPVERRRQLPVHVVRLVALDGQDRVPVAAEQRLQLLALDPRRHRRVGDLVAVEVQDRQHRTVVDGVDELVGVPRRGQRAGLELAVPDDGRHHEVGVVHRGAVGVGEHVAELAALVDRAGCLGRDVARYAAREGELPEQPPHPLLVGADVRVGLAVGALEPGVGDGRRTAVAGPGQEDRVDVALPDQPVEVGPEQVQPRRGAPVAQQPGFDVLLLERTAQQRVVQEVDLPDGQVVRRPPPGVEELDLLVRQGRGVRRGGRMGHGVAPRVPVSGRALPPPCPIPPVGTRASYRRSHRDGSSGPVAGRTDPMVWR